MTKPRVILSADQSSKWNLANLISSGKMRQRMKSNRTPHTSPQYRTRTQDTSLLTPCSFFFTMWPMHTYYGIWLDTLKHSQSGLYNFYLFLIDGKSYPVNDNSRSWVWVHQSLASFTVSQDMSCHTIAFQTLVSSWHSLESCKKTGAIHLFCFVSNKEIQSTWQNRFHALHLNVSQRRKERPFSWKLFKLNQYSCLDGVSLIRTEMH